MNESFPKSSRRFRRHGPIEGTITLDDDSAGRIRTVLRLEAGDRILLVDDAGGSYLAELEAVSRAEVTARIVGPAERLAPPLPIVVGLALLKGKRMDWAIEKLAEVGVNRIIPIRAERSISESAGMEKRERWARIAASAAMQSGHASEPVVEAPIAEIDKVAGRFDEVVFLDTSAPTALLEWRPRSPRSEVLLLVGPEGGWTDAERDLVAASSKPFHVGESTFRAETAAIVAAFLLGILVSKD